MKTAVIILGHGSKSAGTNGAVRRIVAEVKGLTGYDIVERAFLQYVKPTLEDACERCIREKAGKIIIVPFFMQSGTHVTKNIPELVKKVKKLHPGIDIIVTNYVGAHPMMAKIVNDLVKLHNSEI